jgi:hypothetical protein
VITQTQAPFCVDSVRSAGHEVLHGVLTLAAGVRSRLDVSLSTQCATIDGHVFAKSRPAPFARVLLLMSGSPKSPGDMVQETSDEEGAFSFTLLPAGQYMLWAWTGDDLEFPGPANLADVETMASVVVVKKGERGAVQVIELDGKGGRK